MDDFFQVMTALFNHAGSMVSSWFSLGFEYNFIKDV